MRKSIYPIKKSVVLAAVLLVSVHSSGVAQLVARSTSRVSLPSAEPSVGQQSTLIQPAGATLRQVVRSLEQHYQTRIVYEVNLLGERVCRTDVVVQSTDRLHTVLNRLLKPQQLRAVQLKGGGYAILPDTAPASTNQDGVAPVPSRIPAEQPGAGSTAMGPVALLNRPTPVLPAPNVIALSGRVTESNGAGLPGVTVALLGTTTGTITDVEGNYKLSIPDERANGTLVFSSIGYLRQEVPLQGRTTVNIVLVVDTKTLNEVVVVGYGTQERKTLTSAQTSVKPADILTVPTANLNSALQGRAAGVQIIQNGGAPGAPATVRIRGVSSLRAGNDPLYVVDGVPITGGLNDINPNDIESIDILKDAAAVAVYGARASGGVVLITTKRGTGKSRVTLTSTYGFQNISKKLEVLPAPELLQVMKEMYDNTGLRRDPFFTQIDTTVNVDWANRLLRNNAPIRTVDLSASGGEGRVRYATSINYFNQDGIVVQSGFQRVTGRLNLDVEVSKKMRFGNSLSLINTRPQNAPENGATNVGVYLNSLVKNPLTPERDPTAGGYNFVELYGNTGNPLASLYEVDRRAVNNRIFGNVFAEYTPLAGLSLRTSWGLDASAGRNDTFNRSTSNQSRQTSGSFSNGSTFRWVNTNTVNYTRRIAEVHNINVLGVYELTEDRNQSYSAQGSQFPNDKVTTLNAAALITNAVSSQSASGLESLVGRVTYSFRDKYVLSANVRRDGSSRFGKNNRYGTFPSVSVAWNVADEPFMKAVSPINFFKLRGSAGQVGNQNGLGNYNARGLYLTGNDYGGEPGVRPGVLPNFDLKWETTSQYNVGMDVGFFNERVVLTADAYLKDTKDMLIDKTVPQSAGTGGVTVNLGRMQNKGLEFSLTTRNFTGSNTPGSFKWNTNLNLALNRNKIVSLYGNPTDIVFVFATTRALNIGGLESVLLPGQPVGLIYGYEATGIYARNEDNTAGIRNQSATGYLFGGGDVIFVDQDGDKFITPSDRVAIGRPQPLHTGGINNTLSYKGFSLDVFVNWSYGNQVYNATRQSLSGMETPSRNYLTDVRNRWRTPGDVTDVARAATGIAGSPNSNNTQSRFLEDGSYLRLNNVTFAYQLPLPLVQRLRMNTIRAYVTGNNLALLTRYRGIDPDVRSFTNEGQYGIDFGAYPRVRTITFGLSLGF